MAVSTQTITLGDLSETSIQAAVAAANGFSGTTTINFASGLSGTVLLTAALDLGADILIDGDTNGDGKADITLSGQDQVRVFFVNTSNADVTLKSLNIIDGKGVGVTGSGGAIATVAGASLFVVNSTISGSHSDNAGGAISAEGLLSIVNSTIHGNDANVQGGAIYLYAGQLLTMVNTTITGNTANQSTTAFPSVGGGIATGNDATISATNTTIAGNTADAGGGVSLNPDANLELTNTIVVGNTATFNANVVRFGPPDGTITAGNSIVGSDVTITTNNGNNIVADTGIVGALSDNGGIVKTMAPTLLAINKGVDVASDPLDADNDAVTAESLSVDARGTARKFGGTVDIGAHESHAVAIAGGTVTEDSATASTESLTLHTYLGTGTVLTARAGNLGASGTMVAVAALGTVIAGKYGALTLFADGFYKYTLDNADADTNALSAGQGVADVFTYSVGASLGDSSTIVIVINGANDAPIITTPDGGLSKLEHTTGPIATIAASDVDSPTLTFSLAGLDASFFQISNTGVLSFNSARDFEDPLDADGDNIYQVTVQVSDGTAVYLQTYNVGVGNVAGNIIKGRKAGDLIDDTNGVADRFATDEEDKIDGKAGNDTIKALGGDDIVRGGTGLDSLDGGSGDDTVDYSGEKGDLTIDLGRTSGSIAKAYRDGVAEDKLRSFENAIGGKGDDLLTGDKRGNMLMGDDGDDLLNGGKGAARDILSGGRGNDSMIGGDGSDSFLFIDVLSRKEVDHVADFKRGHDKILLDSTIFAALGPTLEAEEFVSRTSTKPLKAKEADDHLLYNRKTGGLYYDADGRGGDAAILFAKLDGAKPPALDITDFDIV
ncbi:MAG: VCBS domain-containing protein [Devosia sp.]